jgi:uncharacterized protein
MSFRKKIRAVTFFAVPILLAGVAACSQQPTSQPAPSTPVPDNVRSSKDVVKASAAQVSIPTGGNGEAIVTLSILPGYHVNANPATFPYLIATQVTAGTAEGISADKPLYPSAEKKKFAFAEELLAVYEGEAQIKLPVRADAKAKGPISIPIDVRVQACDQEKCFPPDTLHLAVAAEVR